MTMMNSPLRRCSKVAWLLMATTALTPVLLDHPARAEDSIVIHSGSTAKIATPVGGNGVPVIDIAKPSSSGVSHNQYDKFNVNSVGLVLNNANSIKQSNLAGYLPANTNFGGGAMASMILNEVVAANRSALNGFIEVNGQKANVIIANPYGITCSGCGFINTPRVTLTTGVPTLSGGNLSGFSVAQGDILISGTGMNASAQDIMDLVARKVKLDAPVNAKNLMVTAGPNDWDYANRSVSGSVAGSGAVPDYAIDSVLLGGMYADRISLIATEAGVGVRMLGDAAASGADFTLSAAGKITLTNNVSAATNLSVTSTTTGADALTATGAVLTAGGDLSLTNTAGGGATVSGGTLKAGGALTIQQDSLSDSASGSGGDLNKRSAAGDVSITTTNATSLNGVSYQAGGALTVSAGSLSVGASGATLGATGAASLSTTSGALALGTASVKSEAGVTLDAQQGALSTSAGGAIQATTGNVTLKAKTTLTNAVTVSADAGTLTIRSNNSGGSLSVTNTGTLNAGSAVDIAGYGATPNSAVNLTAGSGSKIIGDTVSVKAGTLDNSGGLQGANGTSINATTISNQSGGVMVLSTHAGQDQTVIAGSLTNAGTIQSAAALTVTGTTAVTNSGTLIAATDLTVQGSDANTKLTVTNSGSGVMQATNALTITGQGGGTNADLTVSGGTLIGDTATIGSQTVTNAGTIQGTNGTTLTATTLNNQAGGKMILSTQANQDYTLTLTTLTNAGTLQSPGALTINSGTGGVTNSGNLLAAGAMTIRGSSNSTYTLTNSGSGRIQGTTVSIDGFGGAHNVNVSSTGSNSNVKATTGALTLYALGFSAAGGFEAATTLDVSASSIDLTGSSAFLLAGTSGTIASTGAISNAGMMFAPGALTVTGTSISNSSSGGIASNSTLGMTANSGNITNSGALYSGGAMTASATGTFTNDATGTINSNSSVDITAPTFVNNNAINTQGNITIGANTFRNEGSATGGVSSISPTIISNWGNQIGIWPPAQFTLNAGPNNISLPSVSYLDNNTTFATDPTAYTASQQNASKVYDLLGESFTSTGSFGNQPASYSVQRWAEITSNGGTLTVRGTTGGGSGFTTGTNQAGLLSASTVNLTGAGGGATFTAGQASTVSADYRAEYTVNFIYAHDAVTNYSQTPGGGTIATPKVFDCVGGDSASCSLVASWATQRNYFINSYTGGSNGGPSTIRGTTLNISGVALTVNGQSSQTYTADGGASSASVSSTSKSGTSSATAANAAGTIAAGASLSFGGLTITLPTSPNGYFVPAQTPGAKYLIETNPRFGRTATYLGSNWLVDNLPSSASSTLNHLGDANYEAKLIIQQLTRQIGSNLLKGFKDQQSMLSSLFTNALNTATKQPSPSGPGGSQLILGQPLTPTQVSNLKSDIVWMVETKIGNETVLVPKVYLAPSTLASLFGGGSTMIAENINLNVTSLANNGGKIEGTNRLNVTSSGDISNTKGTLEGKNVNLTSTGDMTNTGGTIGGQDVTIASTGGGLRNQGGGTIDGKNTLQVTTKTDINNTGSTITGGNVTLTSKEGGLNNSGGGTIDGKNTLQVTTKTDINNTGST
ncbi:MAG: filamentous hemagglutinin N-terminal domain-containing protein, partial [Rhodospirillales bacterium]